MTVAAADGSSSNFPLSGQITESRRPSAPCTWPTAVITDFDPRFDQLQLVNYSYFAESSDHHGGTLLKSGTETIDLLGVSPKALPHNWSQAV